MGMIDIGYLGGIHKLQHAQKKCSAVGTLQEGNKIQLLLLLLLVKLLETSPNQGKVPSYK